MTHIMTTDSRKSTFRNALIIAKRELRDSFRDWRIVVPIIVLTFFFPFLAQGFASNFLGFVSNYGAEIIGERTIPFLLMIVGFFPISISLVIALETFVGEKERRSLEPLLTTPLTNTELYIGKTLASTIPPLLASFGGMSVYLLTLVGSDLAWRPPLMLVVQIFVLTIVQALVMVTGAVVVSSQTTSTRAANLLASFIIIPMTLLINGESFIMFIAPDAESPNGIGALWVIAFGMLVVVALLLRMGNAIFNREELLGRMIDQVNLASTIKGIWRYIIAIDLQGTPAKNLWQWYTQAIPFSLRQVRVPVLITTLVFVGAFGVGMFLGTLPEYRLNVSVIQSVNELDPERLNSVFALVFTQFFDANLQAQAIFDVMMQNGRILLAGLILSVFSFGVAPYVLIPIVYVVMGYALSQFLQAGFGVNLFFGATLTHGIVEIPMMILATATMFRLGTIITRPPHNMTLGQAWTLAFGDTFKLTFGVIIPLMLVAAIIEIWVTPQIILSMLQ
jgi:uncharacterized membrane protein SpoIIM required for sporulation/ABC-type transport system involved in multi-copper enzyme maturation permease subunit